MSDTVTKSRKRKRADIAKKLRCTTLTCVLENPTNPFNVGGIIRNIDMLGVGKLYIVGKKFEGKKNKRLMHKTSCGSSEHVYVRYFDNSDECIKYLNKKKYISMCTSPHVKNKDNYPLMNTDFTKYKKLAIWFGSESSGISDEVLNCSSGCVNIDMSGIGESLNLANANAIILQHIAYQRRQFKIERLERKSKNS